MRRRDPPPPKAVCVRCGWTGTPNHTQLRDEHGDVSLTLAQKACPVCGTAIVQLREEKPALSIQIVTAVREADLTPEQLLDLVQAVRQAPSGTTPRELAAQVPVASRIITIASRAGEGWIGVLALVLAVIAIYIAHNDGQQAHRDAEKAIKAAHQDAQQAHRDSEEAFQQAKTAGRKTGTLSKDEVRRIAEQLERDLGRSSTP